MQKLVVASGISKRFGEKSVIWNVSFELGEGECLEVLGENGSGKTTLLKIIAGVLKPTEGKVILSHPPFFIGHNLPLYPHLSARENITFWLKALGKTNLQPDSAVARDVGLDPKALGYKPHQLSQGMQKRVMMIVVKLAKPKVLLWDEPFANLDGEGREKCIEILKEVCVAGGCVILSSPVELELPFASKKIFLRKR